MLEVIESKMDKIRADEKAVYEKNKPEILNGWLLESRLPPPLTTRRPKNQDMKYKTEEAAGLDKKAAHHRH